MVGGLAEVAGAVWALIPTELASTTIAARHTIREDIIACFRNRQLSIHSNISCPRDPVNDGRHKWQVTKNHIFPNWESQIDLRNAARAARRVFWFAVIGILRVNALDFAREIDVEL